jgi:Nucleotidyltransferase domain
MDFRNPIEAVIPGVQGRVLSVMLRSGGELNLRTIARLANVSIAQASRVLPVWVGLGLLERREVGSSSLFRLVPDHVASRVLLELADVRGAALREMAHAAGEIRPAPVSVIVFGSFARGDNAADSDIDAIVVRPPALDEDNEQWVGGLGQWRATVKRVSGNEVEILDVGADRMPGNLGGSSALWRDVRRDGLVIFGKRLNQMAGRKSA